MTTFTMGSTSEEQVSRLLPGVAKAVRSLQVTRRSELPVCRRGPCQLQAESCCESLGFASWERLRRAASEGCLALAADAMYPFQRWRLPGAFTLPHR